MTIDISNESKLIADDERIERYLKGQMTPTEESQFVELLRSDKDLRERAKIQAQLIQAMRRVDIDTVEAFQHTDDASVRKIARRRNVISIRHWMAVAASVLVTFLIGFKSYDYYNVTSIGKEYATAFTVSSQLRGDVDVDSPRELEALFKNVENGYDMDSTIVALEQLWQKANQDIYNEYTDYAPNIGWNLAMAYLQNYEKDKAKAVLVKLQEEYPVGTAMGDRICEIIDKL